MKLDSYWLDTAPLFTRDDGEPVSGHVDVAVQTVEQLVAQERIDCDFVRCGKLKSRPSRSTTPSSHGRARSSPARSIPRWR